MSRFKDDTVVLIKKIGEQLMAEVFDVHTAERFHMLVHEIKDGWFGQDTKAPHAHGIFLLTWLFMTIKPKASLDMTRSAIFSDFYGNMELQLAFKRDAATDDTVWFTFTEDLIEIHSEVECLLHTLEPVRAVKQLTASPYFEQRSNDEQHALMASGFMDCIREYQEINPNNELIDTIQE